MVNTRRAHTPPSRPLTSLYSSGDKLRQMGFLSLFWLLNSVFVYLCTLLSAGSDTLTVYRCSGYSVSPPVGLDVWLMMGTQKV